MSNFEITPVYNGQYYIIATEIRSPLNVEVIMIFKVSYDL